MQQNITDTLKARLRMLVRSDHYDSFRDYLAFRRAQHLENIAGMPISADSTQLAFERGRVMEISELLMTLNKTLREEFVSQTGDERAASEKSTKRQNEENGIMAMTARDEVIESGKNL